MTTSAQRALLAALLALSALLLSSAPRWANAHDHPSSGASSEAPAAGLEAGLLAAGWSQSCPANPGRMCCCAGVFALAGAGKASVNANAWTLAPALAASARKFADFPVPPLAAPWWSQARPRAPPLSS